MLACASFFDTLEHCGIDFFTGVPDSLLKHFCAFVQAHARPSAHVIAANEGAAVALAAGHHLASGRLALVYMQNSGLGNAINPLLSLVDRRVYAIPMVLMIGWRGQPGVADEPQHGPQGAATLQLLEVLGLPHAVLPDNASEARFTTMGLVERCRQEETPCALVVKKGTFEPLETAAPPSGADHEQPPLSRSEVVAAVADQVEPHAVIVATTGRAGRELFEQRSQQGGDSHTDFLNVGAMGHASQIALAMALAQPRRRVYCLDGDGALIMHMGALAVIGQQRPGNLVHVVLNNGVHDSVGGQPTAAGCIDVPAVARACGYPHALTVSRTSDLEAALRQARAQAGPLLIDVRCRGGARPGLCRPTTAPRQRRLQLMERLVQ